MKTDLYLIFVINFLSVSIIAFAQPDGYIKTPRGNNIEYYSIPNNPNDNIIYEQQAANLISTNGWNVTKLAGATATYNCHAYAWHVSEGGSNVWVNGWIDGTNYSNPNQAPVNNPTNLEKYWTNNGGYIQKSTKSAYNKAFYGSKWVWSNYYYSWINERDHSAVVSSDPNYFISKWGKLPRYKHKPNECPYESSAIVYYNLNPIIQGSTSALCNSQTRTFTENSMSNISLNYQWSNSSLISTQSGGTGYNYNTVKANSSGNGSSSVTLTVTSPSGSSATSVIYFGVGVPTVPSGIIGFCCNGMEFGSESIYEFTVNHANNQSVNQYNWVVAGGKILEGQGTRTITVKTMKATGSQKKYFDVSVRVGNDCGWSSYLWRSGYVTSGVGPAMFSVYPNPADNEVTISVADAQVFSETDATNEFISVGDVIIYDSFGAIKKVKKSSSSQKSITVNVSDLQKGTYLILINNGTITESHKLIIE